MGEASFLVKLTVFAASTAVQVFFAVVFKLAQRDGSYSFSSTSAVTLFEMGKTSIALLFLWSDMRRSNPSLSILRYPQALRARLTSELTSRFLMFSFILAALYALNNNIAFMYYTVADPGSVILIKSFAVFLTAVLSLLFLNKPMNSLKWSTMLLQVCGLIVVQYDSCIGAPLLTPYAYFLLAASTCITSVSGAFNEHVAKGFNVSIPVQTIVLYFFGTIINLTFFVLTSSADVSGAPRPSFFAPLYSFWGCVLIMTNALLGLVMTAIYKYADAVVKTFSTACSSGFLLLISSFFFNSPLNLVRTMGAFVIFTASYIYMIHAGKLDAPTLPISQKELKEIRK